MSKNNSTNPSQPWGPDNPHPLSTMKTELVWEGKYDEFGNRREVDVAGSAMPLQKIETVDQPRSEAAAQGDTFALKFDEETTRKDDFRNHLIWGDNKLVMASLLKDFKGKIDLIYIDPPFDVGADFTMNVQVGDGKDSVYKDQSAIEMVAYRDIWGKGIDSYIHMMYERLTLANQLLSENGSIYVHCDYRVNSNLRNILNEIFGEYSFQNEIVWKRQSAHSDSSKYGAVHDTILFYAKSENYKWNPIKVEPSPDYIDGFFDQIEESTGRRYARGDLTAGGLSGGGYDYEFRGIKRIWRYPENRLHELDKQGKLHWPKQGVPRLKRYLDEFEGVPVQDIWTDIRVIHNQSLERVNYTTQKPEQLIQRILEVSSSEGDLVADFFCGSGTTGTVAEKLSRKWIMCDLGRFAIHTSRKRLIELQRALSEEGKPYRAFDVYNLGRYERQWWQKERLDGADEEHRRVVLEFFKAEVLNPENQPNPLIHGRKGAALCHVDGIDSMFTREEAEAVAKAAVEANGKECYCLAWEFEMDLRLHVEALKAEHGVTLKLVQIPREIMEKNRKDPPPWLEVAVLEAEPVFHKNDTGQRTVDIKLTNFMPSLAEVPSKELEAIKERAATSGFDFIDFWAVDFDWKPGQPFNHHWQDYRTRKDRSLKTVSDAAHVYNAPGPHTICIKVVDTFGADTSILVKI